MEEDGQATLAQVEAKRGYLLSYHRLLAADDPALLAQYDAWYDALTLSPRALSAVDREIVWIALIAITRQTVGRLHLVRGREAGLSDHSVQAAIALGAVCESWPVLAGAAADWPDFAPEAALMARYRTLCATASDSLPVKAAHLAAMVCQGWRAHWPAFDLHLRAAFDAGATVQEAAEAMSFLIHHCGAPSLVAAAEAWARLAKTGAVPAPFPAGE